MRRRGKVFELLYVLRVSIVLRSTEVGSEAMIIIISFCHFFDRASMPCSCSFKITFLTFNTNENDIIIKSAKGKASKQAVFLWVHNQVLISGSFTELEQQCNNYHLLLCAFDKLK